MSPESACGPCSYLTYIKLSTAIRRNESMAKGLHRALLQQQPEDDSKRSPRPQDLIRLYDIILQVTLGAWRGSLSSAVSEHKMVWVVNVCREPGGTGSWVEHKERSWSNTEA